MPVPHFSPNDGGRAIIDRVLHAIEESASTLRLVTNDDRLYDRTQVILVITGLGAPSLEEVLPGAERLALNKQSAQSSRPERNHH